MGVEGLSGEERGVLAALRAGDPAASPEYTAVAAGVWHSCGLRADDTVVCWGDNTEGQADTPEGTFTAISAGLWHSCGLRADATIACWGDNTAGQTEAPAEAFTTVTASDAHTCGLGTDATIACWGDNEYGQTEAPPGTFTTVTAGNTHTCALATNNTVICWGDIDGGYRKLAHRGSYENLVWVSLSTLYRVLAAQGLFLPARSQRAPAVARPLPDWIEWKRHQIWIYDTTHFPRAGRVAYAILDVVRTFTQKHLTLPAGRSCSTGTLTHHGNDKHVAIVGRLRCRSLRGRQSGGWGALPIRNPRIE